MPAVTVPFTTREWITVQNSFKSNEKELKKATDILTMWRARTGTETYLIFQITEHLLTLDRLNMTTDRRNELQMKALINNYCTVIVRVINYINEICQTEAGTSSIAGAVGRMGIPNWIVDVRHSATHKLMPKLGMLQKAAAYLKEWIWDNYWSKSIQDAMRWAIPNAVIEGQKNKKLMEKKKSDGYGLITEYVRWRNEDPTYIPQNKKEWELEPLNKIAEFLKKEPDVINSLLASDILLLSEEKMMQYQFSMDLSSNIWDVPQAYQLYWSPLIILIHRNHLLLSLLKETIDFMLTESVTPHERRQLSGWTNLYLGVLLGGKPSAFTDANRAEWRPIVKLIISKIEFFKKETALQVIRESKIFDEQKIKKLEYIIGLKIGNNSVGKVQPVSGNVPSPGPSESSKNMSSSTISMSKFTDTNEGMEFSISDTDFTNVPLGLMPDQSCESLYLIIELHKDSVMAFSRVGETLAPAIPAITYHSHVWWFWTYELGLKDEDGEHQVGLKIEKNVEGTQKESRPKGVEEMLEKILKDERPPGADYVLTFGDSSKNDSKDVFIHRAAMASNSALLTEIIRNKFNPPGDQILVPSSEDRIIFPHLKSEDVEFFLTFFYTGKIILPHHGGFARVGRVFCMIAMKPQVLQLFDQWQKLIVENLLKTGNSEDIINESIKALIGIYSAPYGALPVAKRVAVSLLADQFSIHEAKKVNIMEKIRNNKEFGSYNLEKFLPCVFRTKSLIAAVKKRGIP
ncbi:hypothetical protein FO519_001238 [Halicephalobus sp. NKZ332]|nr:hypothetical protein FO519_001238 [Halicephalobus sp. NKZ332]